MSTFIMDDVLLQKVDTILESHDMDKSDLVGILLEVQDIIPSHYIPEEVALYIGKKLDVPASRVYDVVTFYAALSDKPRGCHTIQVCKSTCCTVNKNEVLLQNIEKELNIKVGETTPDGLFSLEYCACFGACDISPAIRIGHEVYGNLNEAKIKEIIESYRGCGK